MTADPENVGARASHDRRLAAAIDEFFDRTAAGESLTIHQWVLRHPDLGSELRECLEAAVFVREAAPKRPNAELSIEGDRGSDADFLVGEGRSPPHVPGYTILGEIGRGGMGVVYKAVQHSTRRMVALKVLARGISESAAAHRRFEREVELAAALDHPNIVKIFDSGQTVDGPYCAMEYVDGQPLHHFVASRGLLFREKLLLFVSIAEAVHYAHQRTVVHRDLKPSNIMIDGEGRPRILDFGLARHADSGHLKTANLTMLTGAGQLVGTLPYLSPEQASGTSLSLDVRSDVYALGVIVYEMLTKRLPCRSGGGLGDVLYSICHDIPSRPSYNCREISADLDAVILKSLEKSRELRYQSAAELARDIDCCLRREPPEAIRTTRFYVLRKVYARHRRQVQAAAAAFMLVLLASGMVLHLYLRIRQERNDLEVQLHVTRVQRGAAHLAAGHDKLAEDLLLPEYLKRPDAQAYWSLASFYVQNPLIAQLVERKWNTTCEFSRDGLRMAYGTLTGEIALCNARTLGILQQWTDDDAGIGTIGFAPDGRLISGGLDGRISAWNADDGTRLWRFTAHKGAVRTLRICRATNTMLTASTDGRALLWDFSMAVPEMGRPVAEYDRPVVSADLSADGKLIAIAIEGGGVRVSRVADRAAVSSLEGAPSPVEATALSSDGRFLATWQSGRVQVWETTAGRRMWNAPAGMSEPRPVSLWDFPSEAKDAPTSPHIIWKPTLRFSDDDALLACTGWDAAVRLWNTSNGAALMPLRSHPTAVYGLAFRPRSHDLAAATVGGLRLWDLDHHPDRMSTRTAPSSNRPCIDVSGSAGLFTWDGAGDGRVSISRGPPEWETQQVALSTEPIQALALNRNGKRLAVADKKGLVGVFRLPELTLLATWQTSHLRLSGLSFSPDGRSLALGGQDGVLEIRRCQDGSIHCAVQAHASQILCLAFSPDSRFLATGGTDWWVRVWNADTGSLVNKWRHIEWVNAIAFDEATLRIATAGADLVIELHDSDGRRIWRKTEAHAHWIMGLAFLDQGRILVSGGYDGALRFWNAETAQEMAVLPSIGGPVQCLACDDHGKRLVVRSNDAVQVIDLADARRRIELLTRDNRTTTRSERSTRSH